MKKHFNVLYHPITLVHSAWLNTDERANQCQWKREGMNTIRIQAQHRMHISSYIRFVKTQNVKICSPLRADSEYHFRRMRQIIFWEGQEPLFSLWELGTGINAHDSRITIICFPLYLKMTKVVQVNGLSSKKPKSIAIC